MEKPPVKDQKESPLADCILDNQIQKPLEKPLKLNSYDGKEDLDEDVQHVDNCLNYYRVDDLAMCNLFELTLTRSTMIWLKDLPPWKCRFVDQLV